MVNENFEITKTTNNRQQTLLKMSTAEIVEDSVINGSVSSSTSSSSSSSSTEPVANRRGAPMKKSNKIRSKQPRSSKKVKFITTEIRCQEKSKGGLSYEVILAEPAPNVTLPKRPVTPGKNVSAEEIEQKLKAAEERRLSLEAKKMAELSAKMEKIEEASRKKDEINNEFIKQTKEELEIKMQKYEEQREAIISDLKEKLKTHSQEIEKTRNSLEQQKYVERIAIDEKLKSAASLRDDNLKKMLERLKEHNTVKIAEIKSQIDALESQKVEEKARIIENKLYTAQQNREKAFQQKLENIRKHERRAEIVRQNKAALGGGNGATNNQNECENNLISAASD